MKDVAGFTLIEYIKSSIEILMNMKQDEKDTTTIQEKKSKKKSKAEDNKTIKFEDKTPSSSI